MILFDTGDAEVMIPGQPGPGPGERRLRQLLAGLNLPLLEPVPEDHTLTRSFYLLQDFPGRWTGQHGVGRPCRAERQRRRVLGVDRRPRLGRRLGDRRLRPRDVSR